uniref:Actin-associated protein FAM107A n=1 Tax=Astyanax mexicanus TaxID=7994 RepID=A0A8B9GZE7_ASTMX
MGQRRRTGPEPAAELIRPKKLPNPVKASRSHRELHRELLITHKRYTDTEYKLFTVQIYNLFCLLIIILFISEK